MSREAFENLDDIKDILSDHKIYFDGELNQYRGKKTVGDDSVSYPSWEVTYINGAWYAWQEQQKKIDGALKELELLNYYRTGNSDNAIKILKGTDK